MSLGPIVQSIEILSKEKGIDPKIILDAVKDAHQVDPKQRLPAAAIFPGQPGILPDRSIVDQDRNRAPGTEDLVP